MKYVICMGGLYKLKESKYLEFLQAVATDSITDLQNLEKLGTFLGEAKNVTDLTSSEASDLLVELNNEMHPWRNARKA